MSLDKSLDESRGKKLATAQTPLFVVKYIPALV